MRAGAVCALVALLSRLQISSMLAPERGVVLHGEQAGWLLVPHCNRPVPGPVERAWTPDYETIRRLELALGPVLQESLRSIPGRAANDYYRQYAGAVISGERIVYVNGFYGALLEASRDAMRFTGVLQWRTAAVGVRACDGGSSYFGAEYLADSDMIRDLRFDRVDGGDTIPPRPIDSGAMPGSVEPGRIRNNHAE